MNKHKQWMCFSREGIVWTEEKGLKKPSLKKEGGTTFAGVLERYLLPRKKKGGFESWNSRSPKRGGTIFSDKWVMRPSIFRTKEKGGFGSAEGETTQQLLLIPERQEASSFQKEGRGEKQISVENGAFLVIPISQHLEHEERKRRKKSAYFSQAGLEDEGGKAANNEGIRERTLLASTRWKP